MIRAYTINRMYYRYFSRYAWFTELRGVVDKINGNLILATRDQLEEIKKYIHK